MLGGPKDGQESHLVTYKREQEQLFEAGPFENGGREVHVYRSLGGRAPLIYEGTRRTRTGEPVRPLYIGRTRVEFDQC
jgi:hypothetical protein